MRASFNVLDAGWIPVIMCSGEEALLGIRETLEKAPVIQRISCVSPLEEYSVYRFLSVFLMDALRPKRLSDIRKYLRAGQFDMGCIEAYIRVCEVDGTSFDLFDEAHPFMQSPYVAEWDREPKVIGNIDCTIPCGNSHIHFDHRKPEAVSVPLEKAARLILSLQQFCTAAAQGYPSGVNASPPYFSVILGNTLFETLVYTLQPINTIGIPFDEPCALWRSQEPVVPKKEVAETSWIRGMFFPARRVLLIPPENGNQVCSVFLSQGENYKNKESWRDPFATYRTLDSGVAPLRPKREKPVWRSLYEIADIPGKHASAVLRQYVELTDCDNATISLYGVETNQASYLGIHRQELTLPVTDMTKPEAIELLRRCITTVERLAKKLRKTLIDTKILPESSAENAVNRYYSRCEQYFWELCDTVSRTEPDGCQAVYQSWCERISAEAISAHTEETQTLRLRSRDLGAAADQLRWLILETKKIKEEAAQ